MRRILTWLFVMIASKLFQMLQHCVPAIHSPSLASCSMDCLLRRRITLPRRRVSHIRVIPTDGQVSSPIRVVRESGRQCRHFNWQRNERTSPISPRRRMFKYEIDRLETNVRRLATFVVMMCPRNSGSTMHRLSCWKFFAEKRCCL